ncbi:MAG: isopentenyl phosphate kinase [Candidatus Microgenomates bacterium]|jgi:isopentenyl phosphate kinase
MKQKLILIKLGGSLITDKSKAFTAREKVIARLGKEIRKASGKSKIIIGHGSGSFGHSVAAKYQTQKGIINSKSVGGFPLVADAARKINEIVMDIFLANKLPVVSFSPLSYLYTNNQKLKSKFLAPITKSLAIGLIPVIYGDVIMDESMGFCIYSGEKSLNVIAQELSKFYNITIIYCGETTGVYNALGETIAKINSQNFPDFKKNIGGSASTDVTGGMLHKVEESLYIAKELGIQTLIINGTVKGNLQKAILGKVVKGTLISN